VGHTRPVTGLLFSFIVFRRPLLTPSFLGFSRELNKNVLDSVIVELPAYFPHIYKDADKSLARPD
jgi:hypothetical protein